MLNDDGTFFREIDDNCYSIERRLEDCSSDRVDVQVLSTVPVMFSYWAKPEDCLELSRILNDDIAEHCRRFPKRFVGLGTLPMQSPQLAVQELRRCVQDLGLAGVQIGTHINQWNLSAQELFPVFEEAERLGACIFIHPWDMIGKGLTDKYWLSWLVSMPAESAIALCHLIFGGVFERLPNLRVAVAHGGGSFPGTIGRIQHGWKVRPDLCQLDNKEPPRKYLGKFWVDSLTHDEECLRYLVNLLGEDRVCLGTDYPFPLGEVSAVGNPPGTVIRQAYSDERTIQRLLALNAFEWLGLDYHDFLPDDKLEDTITP